MGSRLLRFVIDEARGLGVERIHLWVLDPARSAARRLYHGFGFAPQGALVLGDLLIRGRYIDAEYMTLALGHERT